MYGRFSIKLRLTHDRKTSLHHAVIDQDFPGTILHDFNAVLNLFRETKQILTPAHQLTLNTVKAINQRLKHPLQLALKRPVQKSYPHIHGLYLLIRASGLTYVNATGKQLGLSVDETAYAQWVSLNDTERYFSLLEAWLLRGYAEILGDDRRPTWDRPDNFDSILRFFDFHDLENKPLLIGKHDEKDQLKYTLGIHNLGLLHLFGLISVQAGASKPNEGWNIEQISLTPFGGALLALLNTELPSLIIKYFNGEENDESEVDSLKHTLRPYFPAWQNNFTLPETPFTAGIYVFKVSLGNVWRQIAIDANAILDQFASAILVSVNFDDDHLYEFSYRTRLGRWQRVSHPYLQDELWTSEVRIGDLQLMVGQTMTFLFDFGDNWEFDVRLEAVESNGQIQDVEIRASHGEAPEQYPGGDDDWELFDGDEDE